MPKKKVLVISYYWPPAGGIAVLRSLKIVKYLREFGWEPIVYAPKNAQYPYYEPKNQLDVPEGVTVLRQPILEPFALFNILRGKKKDTPLYDVTKANDSNKGIVHNLGLWVRGNFFIPDARSFWIKPSVKYLVNYLKTNPVDAIFSDGPPHTNTVIAQKVSEATGTPWLMDFQDPWTQVDYYKDFKITSWGDAKHKRMEQACFKAATQAVTVSKTWAHDLIDIGAKAPVEVVVYGYDEADFSFMNEVKIDEKFTISHLGLLGDDRVPHELFELLGKLIRVDPKLAEVLQIQLFGTVDASCFQSIEKHGLERNVVHQKQVSRAEALRIMAQSQVLLLLLNKQPNAKGRTPGKLFEYLRVNRPILSLGPEDSDVGAIIRETSSGVQLAYNNKSAIESTIIDWFHQYKNNTLNGTSQNYEQFSNYNLTRKMAQLLNQITEHEKH